MDELEAPRPEKEDPCSLRLLESLSALDAERSQRLREHSRVAVAECCRHGKGSASRIGEPGGATLKGALDGRCCGQGIRERGLASRLTVVEELGKLYERERIPIRRLYETGGHGLGDLRADPTKKVESLLLVKAFDDEFVQSGGREFGLVASDREEEGDCVAGQPPGGEQDRVGRGGIDPLEVVHHDEQRLRLRRRCEKAQRSRRYSLWTSCLGAECKRTSKCLGLLRGNLFKAVGEGNQQVVQTSIGQWCLRLDPARSQDAQVVRQAERITEEGCFSDPRLAPEDESRPVSEPCSCDEIVDPRALRFATKEHRSSLRRL